MLKNPYPCVPAWAQQHLCEASKSWAQQWARRRVRPQSLSQSETHRGHGEILPLPQVLEPCLWCSFLPILCSVSHHQKGAWRSLSLLHPQSQIHACGAGHSEQARFHCLLQVCVWRACTMWWTHLAGILSKLPLLSFSDFGATCGLWWGTI